MNLARRLLQLVLDTFESRMSRSQAWRYLNHKYRREDAGCRS